MLKSSKHQALSREFLAFMHTKAFADIIPTANWAYPVVKTTLPKAFDLLHRPKKMMLLDGKMVEAQRKAIIHEWLKAIQK